MSFHKRRQLGALSLAGLLLVSPLPLLAQQPAGCPTIPSNQGNIGWAPNISITMYIDPSLPQASQIQKAFENWNAFAPAKVTMAYINRACPWPTLEAEAQKTWCVLGTSAAIATTKYSNNGYPGGWIGSAQTVFPTAAPASIAVQLMAHEIGHTFYLGDCLSDSNSSCINTTVMEKPTTTNSVSAPTQCDAYSMQKNTNGGYSGKSGSGNGIYSCSGSPPTCPSATAVCQGTVWQCESSGNCPGDPPPCSDETYAFCTVGSGWQCEDTPIILDLFGEGFHLTDVASGVSFQTKSIYPSHKMSWTDPNYRNAWLALDRNRNGRIDDMTELFGNLTPQPTSVQPNGYAALAVFDKLDHGGNGNGWIDPEDAIYERLRLWIDGNHDGISQPEELFPLQDLGLFKISLHYFESGYVDANGNQFRLTSRTDSQNKSDRVSFDVFLIIDSKANR